MEENNKRLNIDIPRDLHVALKTKCATESVSMTDMVQRALEDLVRVKTRRLFTSIPKDVPDMDAVDRLKEMHDRSKRIGSVKE